MNPFDRYLKPEDILHIQVCRYVKLQYKGAEIHHSPNEGRRTPFERYLYTALNTQSGFPDLLICHNGKTIAIELKAVVNAKGKRMYSKASPKQEHWVKVLSANNIPAKVCKGFDEAKLFIDSALK